MTDHPVDLTGDELGPRVARAIAMLDLWKDDATVPTWGFFVPGRIEVLGKHTDYAGGRSIVAATRQGLCLVARPRSDARLRMADLTRQMEIDFEIEPGMRPVRGHWSNYPQTVARRLQRNFGPALRGADVAFTSNLPRAAGMSSSSALIVAVYLVLAKVNGQLAEKFSARKLLTIGMLTSALLNVAFGFGAALYFLIFSHD